MNVINLLKRFNIPYVEKGSNVAKGNINVKCPWCGEADPSEHLGIHVGTGKYGCWRSSQHRGRRFSKVLAALAGISITEARHLSGELGTPSIEEGEFERAVESLSDSTDARLTAEQRPSSIELLPQFKPLWIRSPLATRFKRYLHRNRGFKYHQIDAVCRKYQLYYSLVGEYSNRIIFPIFEGGRLVTWTSRSVFADATLRYKALQDEKSVKNVKQCVYNWDLCNKQSGNILFIVEGPFDAIKIDFYGRRRGLRAVALFNMIASDEQVSLLHDIRKRFSRCIVMLDRNEIEAQLNLGAQLAFLKVEYLFMDRFPRDWLVDDPGDLTREQVWQLPSIMGV